MGTPSTVAEEHLNATFPAADDALLLDLYAPIAA